MYFIKLTELKRDLIQDKLGQSGLLKYLLVYVVLTSLIMELGYYFPYEDSSKLDHLSSFLTVTFVAVGTYLAYLANGGASGQQFAERYFSIGFVVSIRFLIFLIPITFIIVMLMTNSPTAENNETTWYEFIALTAWEALLYWRIIYHINDVAKKTSAQSIGQSIDTDSEAP